MCIYMCIYIHVMYICVYMYMDVYLYIYTYMHSPTLKTQTASCTPATPWACQRVVGILGLHGVGAVVVLRSWAICSSQAYDTDIFTEYIHM